MARQFIVPGEGYINATVARQYLSPGLGFINEIANVYNDSISESITVADSNAASLATTSIAINDSITANYTVVPNNVFSDVITESIALADSIVGFRGVFDSISESITVADAFNPTLFYRSFNSPGGIGLVNESGTRQYLVPGGNFLNDGPPYKSISGGYVAFNASTTETITAADSVTTSLNATVAVSDVVILLDNGNTSNGAGAGYGEAGYGEADYGDPSSNDGGSSIPFGTATFNTTPFTEAITVADAVVGFRGIIEAFSENITVADSNVVHADLNTITNSAVILSDNQALKGQHFVRIYKVPNEEREFIVPPEPGTEK